MTLVVRMVSDSEIPQGIDSKELAEQVDIVEIVSECGVLLYPQRNGQYTCLCPFHDDVKSPSMRIYPDTYSWWCYGCNSGGSVYDFLMKWHGIEFPEAFKMVLNMVSPTTSFELRDLRVPKEVENINSTRQEIEIQAHAKLNSTERRIRGIIDSRPAYEQLDALWRWYDNSQILFDSKIAQGVPPKLVTEKLYDFWREFLVKVSNLNSKV